MTSLLHAAYNSSQFREQGHLLIDLLADYLQNIDTQSANKWTKPAEQLHLWENDARQTNADVSSFFEMVLADSIHLHHKKYMGHQISPAAPVAALSSLLSAFLNNGMAVYEMGASASALEKIVTDIFCKVLGYSEQAGGFLTSGGTLANLTALLCARQVCGGNDIWQEGQQEKLAIMVSEEAHYCIDRAARIMGLGAEGIIKVPTDQHFMMQTNLLEDLLDKAQKQGKKVFAIIGSACSTSTGSYDDLEAIANFAEKHRIWLHIDGAHGGAAAFSQKYKYLLKGVHKANSIAIDCHKMMMVPSITTALLFRNESDSFQTFAQKAQYLWDNAEEKEWYNYGKRTLECTKLMMSIKVYSLIRTYSVQVFDDFVTTLYDLGRTFAQMISAHPKFELATSPSANIVCFRLVKNKMSQEQLNELNGAIRKNILEKGDFYIVQTAVRGKIYLRTTLMNPFTTEKELSELLHYIENLAL
ncbi:MAG: aminotransferase class I/II-fold pyridoxal phosphate-dependent enzyme [Cytophagales bacterium]|nr:MAG: aminotransferase class I/II-fold pyridoxal phosphate-dependent enzyme [Cytophagales bacterium]